MAEGFKLYHYNPSAGAAVAFAAVFGLTTCYVNNVHLPVETFGYLARYASAEETPNWTTKPYIAQSLMLLLAPAFFAASIYMILGRIIRVLNGASCSMVRPSWLTKIFVTGDVLSFLIQSGGGGMLATAKTASKIDLGNNMIVVGLFVQIIFFGFFILVSLVFHRRMLKTPLHDGSDGYLQSKEAFVYVFDAALMFICCLLFNIFHPSGIISGYRKAQEEPDLEMLNNSGYK
ncbi:hypothetical protein N7452_008067 [Penicillium brevicompactum]|uniref:Uncharacterized protein n=1 Tax=Penicillium brevicompactum TaxID=5074 RepID=A0A9W9U8Q7_PENBR|nr:hypothetical protein N7452_008067 [Penicillium brevicompactum]